MKNALLLFCVLFIGTSFGQTTLTWTGSSSTDWSTASNWTPAAVPGASSAVVIGSATNQPVLAGNTTIASLTLNSGAVLDLGTYSLTVSGSTIATSAQVNNGQISGASFTATSSTFGAKTSFSGGSLQIRNSTFNAKSVLTETESIQTFNYGNTFNSPVELCNTGAQALIFGYTSADVFNDSLKASVKGTHNLVLAHSSTGNAFNGYCNFIKDASASSLGIIIGGTSSSATFASGVKITSLAATFYTQQGIGFTNCTFNSTSSLSTDDFAFIRGTLLLANCTLNIPINITLQKEARLELREGTVFNGVSSLIAPSLVLSNFTNNAALSITKTGRTTDSNSGPIASNGEFTLRNVGVGSLFIKNGSVGNQFASNLTLENTGGGTLIMTLNGENTYLAGNLTLKNTSGTLGAGSPGTTNKPILFGDLYIRQMGGTCVLGGIKLDSGKHIYTDTLSNGTFHLRDVVQLGTQALNLHGTSNARISITSGSDFGGNFTAIAPSIFFSNAIFRGDLALTKTGNSIDQCDGNLTIYGNSLFKNTSSSGTFQLSYPTNSTMTYHGDVTYENAGAGNLWMGYAGVHYAKADVIFAGSNSLTSTWSNKLVLNGTGTQAIKRSNTLTNGVLSLEINKASGQANLEMPFPVSINLNLAKGILKTSDTTILSLNTNCTITGGSDSSYVDGPMTKVGTAAFTFPLGGNGVYAPLGIDAVASATTFKAKYIAGDPDPSYSRSSKDTTIGFVNRCGYWNLDRTTGSQNVVPSLGWSNNLCYSTTPVDASVALWDGSTWKDKGNAAYSGTSTAGNVKSTAVITSYPAVLNLGGKCNLQASLAANRDTLYQGYLATFTASPANQSNYKFYVNNVLKQDSSAATFKISTLESGDSVKVIVRNIDNCLVEESTLVNVNQIANLNLNTDWLMDYNLFANDTINVVTSDSIYCQDNVITSNLIGNVNVINASIIQTSSIVEQFNNSGLNLRSNLNNLVGIPIGINDTNIVLSPGIYYFESAEILRNKFFLNGNNNSLFIFNINDDVALDSLILMESSFIEGKNNVIFNIDGNAKIANIALNYYSVLAKNIVVRKNYNLHGSLWAKNNIRIEDPIVFYGQGFPSEPDNCYYPDYPCNRIKNSEFSCPLPIPINGNGWVGLGNNSFGLTNVQNQIYWQSANGNPGDYLQRQSTGSGMQYFLGLNPATNGCAFQQLSGFNIQQGEQYYIKFRYRNSGNACNTSEGYCPLDRLFVSVSEGASFSPFGTIAVPDDASFTNNPTYNFLPETGNPLLPQREYITDSQLGNITNLDWIEYNSGPLTASFDINSISFYARISQGHLDNGDATLWGGNIFIDDVKLESCCLGDLATLVSSKTSDFINDAETSLPTVKEELASIISISPVNPSGFDGSLENIKVTINANNSGTISVVGNLVIDVGELEIVNSELLFSKCSSISFLNPTMNLRKLIINSSFLHSCESKLWNGILINGANSEALYIDDSRIEDALAAVQARNNPLLLIDDNKFNRNVKHIQMRNCKDQINSVIKNNKFLSNDPANPVLGAIPSFVFSETDCEDEYFLPYITNIGIDLQLVNNLTIDSNNFENSYCGIRCLASSIIAEDNTFHLIRNFVNPTDIDPANNAPVFTVIDDYAGCGIFQNNSFLTSKLSTAGGYLYIDNSTFTNLRYGVRILNSNLSRISKNSTSRTDIKIQNCELNNAAYSLNGDILNTAIAINGLRAAGYGPTAQVFAQNMLIEHNYIDGFSYGIDIKDCQSDLDIRFNNISTIIQSNNWRLRTAISLKDFYPYNYTFTNYSWFPWYPLLEITAYEPYFIDNNTIGNSSLRDILVGRGINSDFSSYGNIVSNTVNMYAINTSQSAFGVVSMNSSSVYIVDNLIRRNNASVPSNQQYANNGILIENSKSNIVCENEIYNFASCLRIVNSSNNLQVKCNLFSGYQYQGVSLKNALFGNQVFDTGAPFDNRWIGTSGKRIRGSLNTQTPYDHKWYYGSSTAYPGQLELHANAPSVTNVYVAPFDQSPYYFQTVNDPSSTSLNCGNTTKCTEHAIPTFFGAKRLGQRDSLFGGIINDFNPELSSDTSSADEYSMIKFAFETYYLDPSWLNIGDPSDTMYQNYFLACLDLPMAKQIIQNSNSLLNTPDSLMIDSLETLYNDNDTLISEALNQWTNNNVNQLISENSRMSLIHKADSVAKQALNIYYNTWQKGKYTLTASDSATLNTFAFDDPSISGDGVYLARMLLDTIVVEVEQQARIGVAEVQENSTNDSLNPLVFPNPTNGTFTIDLNFEPEAEVQVSLMDLTGRIVFNATQVSQIKSYSFDYLASGVYLYRIEYNNIILSQDKLVIQKP